VLISLRTVIDAKRRLDELGTARVIGEAAEAVHKTQKQGQPLGKLAPEAIVIRDAAIAIELHSAAPAIYSAPERLKGGAGDRRSDVWSLGVLLWEALTHTKLFETDTEVASKAVPPVVEYNANVPAELDAICMKALARDPANRYQSAKVMAAEISAVLDDAGYPEGLEEVGKWIAKELAPAPKSANGEISAHTTAVGMTPIKVDDKTEPVPAIATVEAKKEASAPTALPAWATKPPPELVNAAPTQTLTGVTSSQLLPARPAVTDEHTRPTTPTAAVGPDVSTKSTVPGTLPPPNATRTPSAGSVPLAKPPSILTNTPAPVVPAAPVVPVSVAPAAPVLKLPDAPPGATVNANTPAMFNGATTQMAGSGALGSPAPAPEAQKLDGTRTAVLGSNAIIEATNAAVSAANPPVQGPAPTPFVVPKSELPIPKPKPALSNALTVPVESVVETIKNPPPAPQQVPAPPVLPAASASPSTPAAARDSSADLAKSVNVVSVRSQRGDPSRGDKSKGDVLAGWGWGTDSHPAMESDDFYEDDSKKKKKVVLIAVGGALAGVALIIVLLSVFAGGKDKDARPGSLEELAAKKSPGEQVAPVVEPPPAPAVDAAPAVVVEPPPPADAAEPAKPPEPDPALAKTEPEKQPEPKQPEVKKEPEKKPDPKLAVKKPEVKKPEVKKPEVKKPEVKKKPEVIAKKPEVKKPDPPKSDDAAAAFKSGSALMIKGDLNGALATFKASLASNPGFAPTWRGIGLVYEKLGKKSQASTAFKRYLQLSPNAGDAEQIRARLERLGS
jgi:hypothetical protein